MLVKGEERVGSCAVEATVKALSLSLGWMVDISDLEAGWGQSKTSTVRKKEVPGESVGGKSV